MREKSGPLATHRWGLGARALWALLLTATLFSPHAALAADEECDLASTLFNSPADNLCVPAIASNTNFTIDGFDTEWAGGIFYDHTEYFGGGTQQARVRASRKATGINKSDLFLFFEVTGDNLATGLDEIRIGLNPGTTPANTTLIKIHPNPVGTTLFKETFTFNPGPGTWTSAGSGDAWMPPANVAKRNVPLAGTWFAEVKISLNSIPTNPITGPDFRLHLELIANDSDAHPTINYKWPEQTVVAGLHDFICSNPQRAHPMSFATGAGGNCPHPDLHIANGLYSCGDVYVLRNGAKSTEIAVGQTNEFHADVTNPGPASASNAEVYLTLLQLGISTGPIAMNYDNANAAIVSFFNDKYGGWMNATDKLDTGSPRPPTPFTVNVGTNTAARFNWRPSDETRFGPPANFVASHKCTAAFVNFKDDPNFANNFSYCNTSIVACPTGQICVMGFRMAQFYPYFKPRDGVRALIAVSAINEPFQGWLERTQLGIEGEGLERIREDVFEVRLPEKGEVPLRLSITPPAGPGRPDGGGVIPGANDAAAAPAAHVREYGSDPIKERNARLRKIYAGRPLVVIAGFVPTAHETGLDGQSQVPLYAPTSYVAFALDGQAGAPHGCGKGKGPSYALSSFVALIGLTFVWRRARRRKEGGKGNGGA